MLVLTRRVGESVRIGTDVCVTVASIGNGQVRIAIEAPLELAVHRGEVYERIARANREAAAAAESAGRGEETTRAADGAAPGESEIA
ncbi:MAG TPA: carbon storage regulator CsrA [Myxococcota bacterium]|jgi:carbon storage regulator|nr:carbon storage regulator CsrA [Myxococcota bacterium]